MASKHWIRHSHASAGPDDELRAAPVVADQCDLTQVQFGEEIGDQGGDRRQREVDVVGRRRRVRAERQLRDDAAVRTDGRARLT